MTRTQATGGRTPWTRTEGTGPVHGVPSLAFGESTAGNRRLWRDGGRGACTRHLGPCPSTVATCTGQGADLQRLRGDHVPKPEGVPLLVDGEPVGSDLQEGGAACEDRLRPGLVPLSRPRPPGTHRRERGAQTTLPAKPGYRGPSREEDGPNRNRGPGGQGGGQCGRLGPRQAALPCVLSNIKQKQRGKSSQA